MAVLALDLCRLPFSRSTVVVRRIFFRFFGQKVNKASRPKKQQRKKKLTKHTIMTTEEVNKALLVLFSLLLAVATLAFNVYHFLQNDKS